MATTNTDELPLNLPGGPTASQRLFSEEVAIALAESGQPVEQRDIAYEFSNGRRFENPNQ